jgi:hypothetical protein
MRTAMHTTYRTNVDADCVVVAVRAGKLRLSRCKHGAVGRERASRGSRATRQRMFRWQPQGRQPRSSAGLLSIQ